MTAIHHRVTIETDDDGRSYLTTVSPKGAHTFRLPATLADAMLVGILAVLDQQDPRGPAVESWC